MPVTARVASFGALAGATKSGVRAFGVFVSLHTSSYTTLSLKFLLLPVGLAMFVTNAIAQRIFWPGECQNSLLIQGEGLTVPQSARWPFDSCSCRGWADAFWLPRALGRWEYARFINSYPKYSVLLG